jgi:hypothetical protein
MKTMAYSIINSLIRKLIFGAGATAIAWLVESGIFDEATIEKIVVGIVALVAMLVSALWTWAKNKWFVKEK